MEINAPAHNDALAHNAATLDGELAWLAAVLEARFERYFSEPAPAANGALVAPPDLTDDPSPYAAVVREHAMTPSERLVLVLTLTPHVRPQLLDVFFTKNTSVDRGFTEFGGLRGTQHSGFLPTGETAAFLLAGRCLEDRFALHALFDPEHFFSRRGILHLDVDQDREPLLSGALIISPEYLSRLTTGTPHKPDYNTRFPAKRISTALDWADLVLPEYLYDEIEEIRAWIEHRHTLLHEWNFQKTIRPGFRSLFHGPPGTGKTLTASLLGKRTGLDVYRIDLSLVVSKYIGETEKNLGAVFDQAQNKNWILFFDEADALFGKRTQTSDAHDRYANQEVAYLLQRVEDFAGVVILATNLKGNIDDAFARRFQSMIYFPIPGPAQRLRLWRTTFSPASILDDDLDLEALAASYELTGGAIVNVVRYASLMALRQGTNRILLPDVLHGIRREYRKEGKVV